MNDRAPREWRWRVADVGSRLGWCWTDLVSWAAFDRRPWQISRKLYCRTEVDTIRNGRCYCGQVTALPARLDDGDAPAGGAWITALAGVAAVAAVLWLAVALIVIGSADRTPPPAEPAPLRRVPCQPVLVGDHLGCRWTSPDGFPFVAEAPPRWGAGAELVARQILDSRNGVTP